MSRLIASILLSILLFPVGAILYLVAFFLWIEATGFRRNNEQAAFLVAGVLTWVFVAAYWLFVWRQTVNWTPLRIARTLYAALGAILIGAVAGAVTGAMDEGFGFFIASVVPPLLWLVASVLVWRETVHERAQRLRSVSRGGAGPAIPCPTCGYDMTGLKGTRCPECGSEFTLDELIAAQPSRAAVELEA